MEDLFLMHIHFLLDALVNCYIKVIRKRTYRHIRIPFLLATGPCYLRLVKGKTNRLLF